MVKQLLIKHLVWYAQYELDEGRKVSNVRVAQLLSELKMN
jgi:hypothetical protein